MLDELGLQTSKRKKHQIITAEQTTEPDFFIWRGSLCTDLQASVILILFFSPHTGQSIFSSGFRKACVTYLIPTE